MTVATDDPFHVAAGSLPPLNGMGFGLAFAEHFTPNERWRISWDADSVIATSGSWRAGAYMKLIHIPDRPGITVVRPGGAAPARRPSVTITEYPIWNIYAQTISLDTLVTTAGQTEFSERQTILGSNVIYPLTRIRRRQQPAAVVDRRGERPVSEYQERCARRCRPSRRSSSSRKGSG